MVRARLRRLSLRPAGNDRRPGMPPRTGSRALPAGRRVAGVADAALDRLRHRSYGPRPFPVPPVEGTTQRVVARAVLVAIPLVPAHLSAGRIRRRPPAIRIMSKPTKAELAKYKTVLKVHLATLRGDVGSMKDEALRASDQDASVDHLADQGTDNYDEGFTLALLD